MGHKVIQNGRLITNLTKLIQKFKKTEKCCGAYKGRYFDMTRGFPPFWHESLGLDAKGIPEAGKTLDLKRSEIRG